MAYLGGDRDRRRRSSRRLPFRCKFPCSFPDLSLPQTRCFVAEDRQKRHGFTRHQFGDKGTEVEVGTAPVQGGDFHELGVAARLVGQLGRRLQFGN